MKGVDIYTSVQTNMQCRRPKQMPVIGMKEEEKGERCGCASAVQVFVYKTGGPVFFAEV